jgi:hypothetical protein
MNAGPDERVGSGAGFTERVRQNQQQLGAEPQPHCDFIVCGLGSSGSVVTPARRAMVGNRNALPMNVIRVSPPLRNAQRSRSGWRSRVELLIEAQIAA